MLSKERHQTATGPPIVEKFGGCALCLTVEDAGVWRSEYLAKFVLGRPIVSEKAAGSQVGRPSKLKKALLVYRAVYPDGHEKGWKTAVQRIEQETGFRASSKTYQRALKFETDSQRQNSTK